MQEAYYENLQTVRDNLTELDLVIQLAEEAAELSQAASKRARILRACNPTPVKDAQNMRDLIEEFADVFLCKDVLVSDAKDKDINSIKARKLNRWTNRVAKSKSAKSYLSNKKYIKKDSAGNLYAVDVYGYRVYKGCTVRGMSDGKLWRVTEINADKYPHCVCAFALEDEVTVRELRPRWVKVITTPACVGNFQAIKIGTKVKTKGVSKDTFVVCNYFMKEGEGCIVSVQNELTDGKLTFNGSDLFVISSERKDSAQKKITEDCNQPSNSCDVGYEPGMFKIENLMKSRLERKND